jgi:hypothetical protein
MTRLEIAEKALAGVFATELAGGADAYHLGYCLRLVVGAYASGNLDAALNGLEVDASARGFGPITQAQIIDLKCRGLEKWPDARIERARRELRAAQKESA